MKTATKSSKCYLLKKMIQNFPYRHYLWKSILNRFGNVTSIFLRIWKQNMDFWCQPSKFTIFCNAFFLQKAHFPSRERLWCIHKYVFRNCHNMRNIQIFWFMSIWSIFAELESKLSGTFLFHRTLDLSRKLTFCSIAFASLLKSFFPERETSA